MSAITDTVHFAQTDLVNWTLVADDTGVVLIDAGFPGVIGITCGQRKLGFKLVAIVAVR